MGRLLSRSPSISTITSSLLQMLTADPHSGGSSLHLLPSAIVEPAIEQEHMERNIAMAKAFAAPYTVVIDNLGDPRTAGAAAVRVGLTTVGTEMAGGGIVRSDALSICKRGVQNIMSHLGIIPVDHQESTGVEEKILKLPAPRALSLRQRKVCLNPFTNWDSRSLRFRKQGWCAAWSTLLSHQE